MKKQVKKLQNSEVEVQIELTKEEFDKYLHDAAKEISKEVKIKGFRTGKAPYEIVVQEVGEGALIKTAMDIAIPESLARAAKDEEISVIAAPKIDIEQESPLKFKAVMPVYPEIKIEGYQKIKVNKKDVKVEDKDIEAFIENITKQYSTWDEVKRAAKKGDKAEVDFDGFDEGGAKLEKASSKNHPLILGENMMIPGFEDEIIGLKEGEEKEFDLKFPKDYHNKSFQGKKVKFKVKVNKVTEQKKPEIDDEFVEKLSGQKKSVDDFKKDIEVVIKGEKEKGERQRLEDEVIQELLKVGKVEVSSVLVEEQIKAFMKDLKHNLSHKGLKYEQYIESVGKTDEEVKETYRKRAEETVKLRFIMNAVIEKEEFKVGDDEFKKELEKIKVAYPETEHKKIEEHYENPEQKEQLKRAMLVEKFFARFIQ